MPELPEVETVVRDLRPLLTGRVITAVRRSAFKLRRTWNPAWAAELAGTRVEAVRRRGKWILVDLEWKADLPPSPLPKGKGRKGNLPPNPLPEGKGRKGNLPPGPLPEGKGSSGVMARELDSRIGSNAALLPLPSGRGLGGGSAFLPSGRGPGGGSSPLLRVHLGMTGQFTVVPADTPEPDHLHAVFTLDNGHELRFRDQRRFGSAEFFADRAAVESEMNAELGPEPFGIDADYFRAAVGGTGRNLKAVLLDQTVVAGVGNIYADEACFRAKLHPGRPANTLTAAECDALREAVEAVLTRAVESRGSTIRDYVGGSGLRGGFQNEFAVYGRTGESCPTCAAAVVCARYAGRASHFCPRCQDAEGRAPAAGKKKRTTRGT
ncbi:bifunctional DNA-formamidopyrimidine glycosylase/DNA-(apurinic or apyrimidinic site) lyase [Gemmata sp. JC673]|uniref:Formamidopyrimidine-DNA glycosylase n=1 Tax=Gemmata algarum TaxID=2975278 RepID=A0ABU5ETA8_9BACT|nr:bifunctional DNA-formamidopyrimidine glycosylase/DNA-(apurinic or apyrimidinic site) lyase [Gemmata algarum]MDY3558562.1 bifunctional DNA-formamidopyrimidine glycosylase/DNA-(apurinic or apyrimidinic site) lyase [Gemmata algarum]